MDRRRQLSHVAFGGAWSEQIADDEAVAMALARLDRAVEDTLYEDLRGFEEVAEALRIACACHPKGEMLAGAWAKALEMTSAGVRSQELKRISTVLRAGAGDRGRPWSAGL